MKFTLFLTLLLTFVGRSSVSASQTESYKLIEGTFLEVNLPSGFTDNQGVFCKEEKLKKICVKGYALEDNFADDSPEVNPDFKTTNKKVTVISKKREKINGAQFLLINIIAEDKTSKTGSWIALARERGLVSTLIISYEDLNRANDAKAILKTIRLQSDLFAHLKFKLDVPSSYKFLKFLPDGTLIFNKINSEKAVVLVAERPSVPITETNAKDIYSNLLMGDRFKPPAKISVKPIVAQKLKGYEIESKTTASTFNYSAIYNLNESLLILISGFTSNQGDLKTIKDFSSNIRRK